MVQVQLREDLLRKYTDDAFVIKELSAYTANKFITKSNLPVRSGTMLADEDFVPVWKGYLQESQEKGVFETLKSHLVQFRFPIKKNISLTGEYRSATLKGAPSDGMGSARGLPLNNPEGLILDIHKSPAGALPVLTVLDKSDFCSVVQALCHRNEPVQLPDSMGAAMIKGINNWSRIHEMKQKWTAENPLGNWGMYFMKNILPNKNLYQDKIIILSKKPYSGVSHVTMGLSAEEWITKSATIRLEHECAHYFTLRRFGAMANNLHDELLADYMGLTKAFDKFDNDRFLTFLGLENYPQYRKGGRMENYLGNPKLSSKSFDILMDVMVQASQNVVRFDELLGPMKDADDGAKRLTALCSVDVLEMASEEGTKKLIDNYKTQKWERLVNEYEE